MLEDKILLAFGDFELDLQQHELRKNGERVHLTPKAFAILAVLAQNPGSVVTQEHLLNRVWPDTHIDEGTLAQNVSTLRKALGSADTIERIPRVGYRLTLRSREAELHAVSVAPIKSRPGLAPFLIAGTALLAAVAGFFGWRIWLEREAVDELVREGFILMRRSNVPDMVEARNRFEQALTLVPKHPLAQAGLAECFSRSQNSSFTHARELAAEAVRDDPTCGECRAILGYILMTREWKWDEAGREFEEAARLVPNDPQVRNWRTQWLIIRGEFNRAVSEAEALVRMDRSKPESLATLASAFYFSGRYKEAVDAADKALGLNLKFQPAYKWRYRSHMMLDEDVKAATGRAHAIGSWSKFSEERTFEILKQFQDIYKTGGRKAIVAHFLKDVSAGLSLDVHRYNRALWKMWIGDGTGALEELEAAVKTRPYDLMFVAVDPMFEPLRAESRFREVVRALGL
jgi:DNA-binding winged helix-turn-helix (wHTH) protein/tetratricopeptide (TPR) repeat protein